MASGDNLSKMGKTINQNPNYKVLTKEEYNALLALASQRGESKQDTSTTTSTPKPSPAEFDGITPKTTNQPFQVLVSEWRHWRGRTKLIGHIWKGWSGGAMVLGNLQFVGRPTNMEKKLGKHLLCLQ